MKEWKVEYHESLYGNHLFKYGHIINIITPKMSSCLLLYPGLNWCQLDTRIRRKTRGWVCLPLPAGLSSFHQARLRGPPESALSPRWVQESADLPIRKKRHHRLFVFGCLLYDISSRVICWLSTLHFQDWSDSELPFIWTIFFVHHPLLLLILKHPHVALCSHF